MDRLPGFRDFYPEPLPHTDVWSADARRYIFDGWRAVARDKAREVIEFVGLSSREQTPAKDLTTIDQRRLDPKDDVITTLALAEEGGQRFTRAELLATCNTLLTAGHSGFQVKWIAMEGLW